MNNKTAIDEIAKLIQNKEADKADTGLLIGLEILKTLEDISAHLKELVVLGICGDKTPIGASGVASLYRAIREKVDEIKE